MKLKYFFFPIFQLVLNPINTVLTLKNIIFNSVFNKEKKYYSGMTEVTAINMYFYYTQNLNLSKSSFFGHSYTLTLDPFKMNKLFHLSPLGLGIMSRIGTVNMNFFASFVFLFSLLFIFKSDSYGSTIFIAITLFSTLFFVNFYELQNYNSLGWMLFPIAIYSLVSGNNFELMLYLSLIGIFSITGIFVFTFILLSYMLMYWNFESAIYIMPVLSYYGYRLLISGHIMKLLSAIGMVSGSRYKRSDIKLNFQKIYILSIIFIAYIVTLILDLQLSFLVFVIFLLSFVNFAFRRFADNQTIYISYLSVIIVVFSQGDFSNINYIAFFILVNPILGFISSSKSQFNMETPILSPVFTKPLIDKIDDLLSPVDSHSLVLMSFKDPIDEYTKIFEGIRVIVEPLHYCSTKRDILLLPNWYSISAESSSSVPLWFSTPNDFDKLNTSAEFILIHSSEEFDEVYSIWGDNFEFLTSLNWHDYINVSKLNRDLITTYLLRKKS